MRAKINIEISVKMATLDFLGVNNFNISFSLCDF